MKRYIAFERNSLMNCVQFILSLYLLLRLLSCNSLLSSNCLHCLKTSTNLSNSIILSNISYESTSVTRTFELTLSKSHKESFVVFFWQFFVVNTSRILVVDVVFFDLRLYEFSLKLLCDFENDFRFEILFLTSNQKDRALFMHYVNATKAFLISRI